MSPTTLDKARQALASYQGLLLEAPSPHRIKRFLIAVNGWCNSRCTFCNIWKYDKALALREEITLEELERNLFGSPALSDVLDIGITGGEPFLRRDLVAVYESMCRHFQRAHIGAVTNGIRHERVVETMSQIVARLPGRSFSVIVSLDGYGETHDRVRGVPGNFERVIKTIKGLRAATPGVLLGFSHTVTPTNMTDSVRCLELAEAMDIGFIYRLAHDAPYLRNEGQPIWSAEALAAVRPVVEELNRRLFARQGQLARLGNVNYAAQAFYRDLMDYYERPRRTGECHSGSHSFLLAHDGQVFPCVNLPMAMGNIRQQPFDEIWHSPTAASVRQPIADWQCHCYTNCETEFSLARRRDVFLTSLNTNWRSLLPGGAAARGRPLPMVGQAATATTEETA